MILTQKDKDNERENLRWLEGVKIKGNSPKKLLKKIIKSNLIKIIKLE